MDQTIRRAISALTLGGDAERHADLAAQRIQHALLEIAIPDLDALDIGVHAEPSRLVGGDFIELRRCDDNSLLFALGDASGKSLAAAMTALMLRYLVRGLVGAVGIADLSAIVGHINAVATEDLTDGSFITFVLGVYDDATRTLRVVNAGHEPPLVLRAGARAVETLDAHDMVLGIDRDAAFRETSCRLDRGDLLVIYTDGLTEATNERGELYTIERLSQDLLDNRDLSAQDIAETLFETVRRYAAGELRDDATILVIRNLTRA